MGFAGCEKGAVLISLRRSSLLNNSGVSRPKAFYARIPSRITNIFLFVVLNLFLVQLRSSFWAMKARPFVINE